MGHKELVGLVHPHYLMILKGAESDIDRQVEVLSALSSREFDPHGSHRVLMVASPHSYQLSDPANAPDLIATDLARMRSQIGAFTPEDLAPGGTHAVTGSYYPILHIPDDLPEERSGDLACIALWDYCIVLAGSGDWDAAVELIATCWRRYYVLVDGTWAARTLVRQLHEETALPKIMEVTAQLAAARQTMLSDLVCFDARQDVYWGADHQLISEIYREWNLTVLEEASHLALEMSAQILDERRRKIEQLAVARRAERMNLLLLMVSLFGGISAVLYLVDFTVSGDSLHVNLIRLAVSGGLTAVGTLMVAITYRRGRLHAPLTPEAGG